MTAPPTQDWEDAIRAAERSLRRETTGIPAMPADQIDGRAGVHAIFGEPVERDGVTVIPVGRTLWGFGGARDGASARRRRARAGVAAS